MSEFCTGPQWTLRTDQQTLTVGEL
jgi:hypothetical protein